MVSKLINLLPVLGMALGGLTACDPALRMVFQNHTRQPIQLTTVYARPGRADTAWQQSLPPGRWVNYFGIGGWDDSTLSRVVGRSYRRWEVVSAGDTLRLQGKSLVEFLGRCPRKGFLQSKLIVDLK